MESGIGSSLESDKQLNYQIPPKHFRMHQKNGSLASLGDIGCCSLLTCLIFMNQVVEISLSQTGVKTKNN